MWYEHQSAFQVWAMDTGSFLGQGKGMAIFDAQVKVRSGRVNVALLIYDHRQRFNHFITHTLDPQHTIYVTCVHNRVPL